MRIAEAPGQESQEFVALAAELFRELNRRGARYCHWKSTAGLGAALAGQTDLDLLVDEGEAETFRQLLGAFGFKPLESHPFWQLPGVEDYLGFDRPSGRLVHLHVHYRLVLGEQHVKNYRLPVERTILDNTRLLYGLVKVPPVEAELVILVLRALLKYRDRDLLRDVLHVGRSGGIRSGILNELRALLAETDLDSVVAVAERDFGFVSPGLIRGFLETVQRNPRSGWALLRLRWQARRELAPYRRRGELGARATYYWRVLLLESRLKRYSAGVRDIARNRKTPASGGLTIALLGGDGSGKTTVVRELVRWLSWKLQVRTYYMGTNQPSSLTKVAKGSVRLCEYGNAACRRVFGRTTTITRLAREPLQVFQCLYALAQAHDRRARYLTGRRQADRGVIVVYDRYPVLGEGPGAATLDGPLIPKLVGDYKSAIHRWLYGREKAVFWAIGPADHTFVLRVDLEAALQRKPNHKRSTVERGHQVLQEIVTDESRTTYVDANQPCDQVLLEVKSALWDLL